MQEEERAGRDGIRLGELLLRRGHIHGEQLRIALAIQQRSGARLGEVLLQLGWIGMARLQHMLRLQRGLRRVLGLMLLAGLPLAALADDGSVARAIKATGLIPLADAEMADISAGSLASEASVIGSHLLPAAAREADVEQAALAVAAVDLSDMTLRRMRRALPIDADIRVVNPLAEPLDVSLQQGALALRLPAMAPVVEMQNLRLGNSTVGDVVLSGNWRGTMTIAVPRP